MLLRLSVPGALHVAFADSSGRRPIHLAVWNGHLASVEFLISIGADINCREKGGYTPLYFAVYREQVDIVKQLINATADISLRSMSVRALSASLRIRACGVDMGHSEWQSLWVVQGLCRALCRRWGAVEDCGELRRAVEGCGGMCCGGLWAAVEGCGESYWVGSCCFLLCAVVHLCYSLCVVFHRATHSHMFLWG